MDDEIIRRVATRTFSMSSHITESSCRSSKIRLVNKRETPVKPITQSTPCGNKRKCVDEGYFTSGNNSSLTDNITPIKSRSKKLKCVTSRKYKMLDIQNTTTVKSHNTVDFNSSFDTGGCKSIPSTQAKLLSMDDSFLEAVDVDVAVKDCCDGYKKFDTDNRKVDSHEQCYSPDVFGGNDQENDHIQKDHDWNNVQVNDNRKNTINSKDVPYSHALDNSCNECMYRSYDEKNNTPKVEIFPINNGDNALQNDLLSINVDWENDSLLDAAVKEGNLVLPASPIPLVEKIRQTLITNVQKPVTHKHKAVDLNNINVQQKTEKETYFDIGPFYGLPSKVKSLIQKLKGISELYSWQKECLSLEALQRKKNLVYALPTSGGKTLVAEILMLREILCCKRNVLFVLPYVSIVQEKVRSMAPFGLEFDFFIEEYAAGKGQYPPRKRRQKQTVYIATIEKALGIVNSLIELQRLEEIGLVVVDEIHLLGESNGRGATLEGFLTKLLYVTGNIQIIGMSATIGNIQEVANFLKADIFTHNFRPVELKEYVKCGDKLYAVNWTTKSPDEFLVLERTVSFPYSPTLLTKDPDLIGGLVLEEIPQNSCLVFCATKKNSENVALLICNALPKTILEHQKKEKISLYEALKSEGNGSICSILRKTLPFGVAYHHSGLTSDEKRLIEEGFKFGTLCCICCTSTLAAGVNLPAKRVILRSPYVGRDFINLSRYKQMVGRAGRAGFGEKGDSILICKPNELRQVGNLLMSSMDEAVSSLHLNDGQGLQSLLLSSVGLEIATTRKMLQELGSCTLLSVQAQRLNIDLNSCIDKVICNLVHLGALSSVEAHQSGSQSSYSIENITNSSTHIINTSENGIEVEKQCQRVSYKTDQRNKRTIHITNSTKLRVSRLGKAAIKGCIQLQRAHILYKDLRQAQASLVLLTCLHLLYLVTPYDLVTQVKPDVSTYISVYNNLDVNELQTTKILGINEGCMMRLVKGLTVTSMSEQILRRFYLTLMLYDLWNQKSVWDVADKFQVPRGFVQTLLTTTASFSTCVLRFCEELSEFWAFKELLGNFSQQLSHCCTAELLPLMDLPAVKRGRARQLYKAGYKTLQLIANADPSEIVKSIDHMPRKVATQIVTAAKLLLKQKADNLREEADEVLEGLNI